MEFCARWTIRLAVALLICVWGRMLTGRGFWIRGWRMAAVLNLVHVVLAMWHFHQGRHAAAALHVANETQRVFGVASSAGIYVNYMFTLWWLADAFLLQPNRISNPQYARRYRRAAQVLVAFMVFNATVVFGQWWWTPVALCAGVLLGAAWSSGRRLAAVQTQSTEDSAALRSADSRRC